MSKYQKYFLLVILLVGVAILVNFTNKLTEGLDIAGGIRVVMEADPKAPGDWPEKTQDRIEKMESIQKTIHERVSGMQGVSEPVVFVQGDNRLVVELPGVRDPQEALRRISTTASLEFYELKDVESKVNQLGRWRMSVGDDDTYTFTGPKGEVLNSVKDGPRVLSEVVNTKDNAPVLTGRDILPNAKAGLNQRGQNVMYLQFNTVGTQKFGDYTRTHVGDYLAVFYDGKLLTAPVINEAIPGGSAEVTGFKSLQEAKDTSKYLNAGALPVPLKVIAKDTVEPTLGAETVNQVLIAGIIGLALVILFMAIYYKLPGIIADIALCIYALFVIAVFKLIGATMSLAGYAALIISIGMAVDANILIFERLKEELNSGKTLRAAIDAGFNRAFTAIFDSNMCTAITCAVLMWKGSPSVQSFAITLLIGVAISMFTAITVTRTILHLLVNWEWAQKPSLYGLTRSWMHNVKWNIVAKRNWFFALSAVLIIPGLIVLGTSGLKKGIEFQSGTSIQASFKRAVNVVEVRDVVSKTSESNEVQLGKDKTGATSIAFIKTTPLDETKENVLRDDLNKAFGLATLNESKQPSFDSVSSVQPTISKELTTNAFLAVLLASAFIVIYLTCRFAIGGLVVGFKFGVCAVIALIHDAAFLLGLFAILGKVFGWEVDSLFVTAVLTVIGFSVHDTIVVFDRIRENMRHRDRGETFEELANKSIIQTLSRSINTSFTVVLTLATLIIFGGPLLGHFYVALLVGIVVGTYSSIFNATPLVVVWDKIANKVVTDDANKKPVAEKSFVAKPFVQGTLVDGESESADASAESDSAKAAKKKTTKKKRY